MVEKKVRVDGSEIVVISPKIISGHYTAVSAFTMASMVMIDMVCDYQNWLHFLRSFLRPLLNSYVKRYVVRGTKMVFVPSCPQICPSFSKSESEVERGER